MKRLLLLVSVLVPTLGEACYNDRDTLGFELYNKPDIQVALTGRFDRFPPLYYTMRIDRLRAKGKLVPDEYDDIAVAYGRLGRNEEALAVLAQKAKLPNLSTQDRYRLFANRGTIEAHKWIHDGAKLSDLPGLKAAEKDIAEALRLNPHAHFGREGTQLEVIRWLIDVKTANVKKSDTVPLCEWLIDKIKDVDVSTTLSGLIMLGGAWESPDAALAISEYSAFRHKNGIGELAYDRYLELVANGHKPLDSSSADDAEESVKKMFGNSDKFGKLSTPVRFKELRKEAEAWHDQKNRYLLSRLNQGHHPDTDKDFWSDWKEPAMPMLPTKLPTAPEYWKYAFLGLVGVGLLFLMDRVRRNRAGLAHR